MSHANIKIVQDAYAAFGRGDIPALLTLLADDVSWGMVGRPEDFPAAGIKQGKAGVAEFFRQLKDAQQITHFEPQRLLAADDTVVAIGHAGWIMNKSGITGENDWVHVFTFRDGKVATYRGHQDTGLLAAAYHAQPVTRRVAGA